MFASRTIPAPPFYTVPALPDAIPVVMMLNLLYKMHNLDPSFRTSLFIPEHVLN